MSFVNRLGNVVLGAVLGLIACMILLVVPIAGVRRGLAHLVICWQELALYAACFAAAAFAGGRLSFNWWHRKHLPIGGSMSFCLVADEGEPIAAKSAGRVPLFLRRFIGGRTPTILVVLYLILYINCCVLCQTMNLAVVNFPSFNDTIKSAGAGLVILGLYLILRGLPGASASSDMARLSRLSMSEHSGGSPTGSHVPRASFAFIKKHPICLGWLVVLSGLPLIYLAWFPLLAIPGIYLVLNWLYQKPDFETESEPG